jgi:hypothetical protein
LQEGIGDARVASGGSGDTLVRKVRRGRRNCFGLAASEYGINGFSIRAIRLRTHKIN